MKVGFIGLGIMGRPMALNLLKGGHEVTVWARRAESMAPLLAAGAAGAADAAAVAGAVDVVFSMVADAADVEQVALGPRGVADGARPGLIYVDMSTIAPAAAQSIAARLAERGVTLLDAPVSGAEVGAINAALTIMVGGDAAAFETVTPLFACLGKAATLIGASGAGQVACGEVRATKAPAATPTVEPARPWVKLHTPSATFRPSRRSVRPSACVPVSSVTLRSPRLRSMTMSALNSTRRSSGSWIVPRWWMPRWLT